MEFDDYIEVWNGLTRSQKLSLYSEFLTEGNYHDAFFWSEKHNSYAYYDGYGKFRLTDEGELLVKAEDDLCEMIIQEQLWWKYIQE